MADDKDFKALIAEQKKTTDALNRLTVIEKKDRTSAQLAADEERSRKMLAKGLGGVGDKVDKLTEVTKEGNKPKPKPKPKPDEGKKSAALLKIEADKEALGKMAEAIEKQGGNAKDSKKYLKAQNKITRDEFKLRRKLADTPGAKKELRKEEREAMNDSVRNPIVKGFKGLTKGFGKLAGLMSLKAVPAGFKALLKFGFMGAALWAVTKFLQSETWAKWKKDLVPKLVAAFEWVSEIVKGIPEKLKAGIEGFKTFWASLFDEDGNFKGMGALFGKIGFIKKIQDGIEAFRQLWAGFFDEKGNFVGISEAWSNLKENVGCIKPALIGLGLAFAALSVLLFPLTGLLLPRLIFGGLMKGGKWLIAKPLIAAFGLLGRALGFGGGLGGGPGFGPAKAGFWSKTVTKVKGIFTKVAGRFTALKDGLAKVGTKLVTSTTEVAKAMWTKMSTRVTDLARGLRNLAPKFISGTKDIASGMWTAMKGRVFNVAAKISALAPKLAENTAKIASSMWNSLSTRFTTIKDAIAKTAPKILSTITNTVTGLWAGIKSRMDKLAEKALKIGKPIVEKLVKLVPKIIPAITGLGSTALSKVSNIGGRIAGVGSKVVGGLAGAGSAASNTAGNAGSSFLKKGTESILTKYPKFAKVLNITKKIPVIGPIISGVMMMNTLGDDSLSKKQKAIKIGGLFGALGGATLGGFLGGMIGLAGGPLAALTGFIGAVGGSFLGDSLGTALGQFMLGDKIDAFGWPFNGIDNLLNKGVSALGGNADNIGGGLEGQTFDESGAIVGTPAGSTGGDISQFLDEGATIADLPTTSRSDEVVTGTSTFNSGLSGGNKNTVINSVSENHDHTTTNILTHMVDPDLSMRMGSQSGAFN